MRGGALRYSPAALHQVEPDRPLRAEDRAPHHPGVEAERRPAHPVGDQLADPVKDRPQRGAQGTRSREIAERAGITEAYLYRHFRSKDEIFQLAIDEPLKALIGRLREEARELAARDDADRAGILLRSHELFLERMVGIAPLAAAALLAQKGPNSRFFSDFLMPRLREVLVVTLPDITGRPVESIDIDMYAEAMLGIHLTLALEALLENEPVDVPFVARQVTEMFASGIARTQAQEEGLAEAPI